MMTIGKADIPLDELSYSPLNPRKTLEGLGDIKASIERVGLIHPLVVRPINISSDRPGHCYEVVCGHRRLAALRELGAKTARCEIRALSDQEAVEVALVENSTRADVPLLEESDSLARLHLEHGLSAEELAGRIGKSTSYVYSRLRVSGMCTRARGALDLGLLTPAAALVLSRVEQHTEQERILVSIGSGSAEPISARHIREELRDEASLSSAPFSLTDALLHDAAGACTACPKTTRAQADLFGEAKGEDTECLDRACWGIKVEAHSRNIIARAEAAGQKVVASAKAAKAAGIISKYAEGQLDTQRWADLDDQTWQGGGRGRTWRDCLGDHLNELEPQVAVIGGVAREIVPRAAAASLLRRVAAEKLLTKDRGATEKKDKRELARREVELARQRFEREVILRCQRASARLTDHSKVPTAILERLLERATEQACCSVCAALAITPVGSGQGRWSKALRRFTETAPKPWAPAISLLLLWPNGTDMQAFKRTKQIAADLGIDVDAIENAVRGEHSGKVEAKRAGKGKT
jgi:ParB/RepB/Spo0J family partition protein